MMADNLFLKIIRKEIPAKIVHEDDHCIAFEDVRPQAPVHVLIIPRKEIRTHDDVTPEDREVLGHLHLVAAQLAQKLGLDPQVFFDISSKASGQSWSMTSYCPVPGVGPETPADRNYDGGFAAALMLKDLKLAMEAAKASGAYTPMGGEAEELYQRFVDRGGASKDFSALIKMIDDSWEVPAGN